MHLSELKALHVSQLIEMANGLEIEEIRSSIGADSLGYISLQGMIDATGQQADHLCQACFTGEYPIPLPDESRLGKHLLEQSISSETLPILNNP